MEYTVCMNLCDPTNIRTHAINYVAFMGKRLDIMVYCCRGNAKWSRKEQTGKCYLYIVSRVMMGRKQVENFSLCIFSRWVEIGAVKFLQLKKSKRGEWVCIPSTTVLLCHGLIQICILYLHQFAESSFSISIPHIECCLQWLATLHTVFQMEHKLDLKNGQSSWGVPYCTFTVNLQVTSWSDIL